MPETNEPKYVAHSQGADGKPFVDGPGRGMGYSAGTLFPEQRFSTLADATAAARCCNIAYQQGMFAAQAEMRKALGL